MSKDVTTNGPAIWHKMHTDSLRCTSFYVKQQFITNMNTLGDNISCPDCQTHFKNYIVENPIINYFNIRDVNGKDIGIFQWTWKLHNSVNARLNKRQLGFDEAYKLYDRYQLNYIKSNVKSCAACNKKPVV